MEKASKKPLISIIIPIYKVEEYLNKCVDSILQQTYENIEVLLIDDGSPDNCPKICDEYKKIDKRIKVIHKSNGGLSDARNEGLNHSSGKYVTFVDSDDYVSKDYIEYLYKLIEKNKTKISVCGHYICFEKKQYKKTSMSTTKKEKIKALEDILYDHNIDICSWGKLYEKELFKKIRFPKGKIFEDTATTYKLFDLCDNIAVGEKCLYYYNIRNDSITTKKFNIKKMDLIEATEIMCKEIQNKYKELSEACDRRLMWAYISTYAKIVYTKKTEFKKEKSIIKQYIKNNRKRVLKDENISRRDRISLLIFPFGDYIFKIAWRVYKKIFN